MAIKEIALAALAALFIDYDPVATKQLLTEDYIQHNPSVPTGRAPIIAFLPALEESGISIKTHRVIAEGDLVVTHNTYDNAEAFGSPTSITFDIFRIENGKVAEHWDNGEDLTPPNSSGHTQVDGATDIKDLDLTKENKAKVKDFITTVLIKGDLEPLADFIDQNTYIEHNSQGSDGIKALTTALQTNMTQSAPIRYKTLHKVIAEGNFVFTMSEGVIGDEPTAFFDLYRLKKGKIVEHWDTISKIPAKMAHENGKF